MPLGSPGCVDGPFLEGGDTLLNGYEVYVGMSGCASDMAGIDWLQALLGDGYRVIPVALRSNVLHLDCALALIKPGLLVWCPQKLIDGLPMSLRDWDKIEVSVDEANRLATNGLVLEEGRVDRRRRQRARDRRAAQAQDRRHPPALRRPDPAGGGLRCAHHPLLRESVLGLGALLRRAVEDDRLGRCIAFLRWTPSCAPPSPPARRRSAAARRRSGRAASRRCG